MAEMRQVLVIDDEPGHRLMLNAVLAEAGWAVTEAADGAAGLAVLGPGSGSMPDVILLDMRLPDVGGLELLPRISELAPDTPVIMLTAFGSVGNAVTAMKRGAFDYLTKPADNDELEAVLDKAWQYGRLLRENARLKRETGEGPRLIGQSVAMRRLAELIDQVADSEATVLISGESGTGKELVAARLHAASPRAAGPLVKVNCAALPAELLESELFGYVKGAFTGAVKDKPGRFQLAAGGTLFLDEVGELPLALQAKLLRALQERVVEPLGAVAAQEVDARIVTATNRDLGRAVAEGTFREDLYFRLNVIELAIPPLRERLDDLPLLTAFLLDKLGRKNRKAVRGVSPEFLRALAGYDWPGNVRELENVLERALILARGETLTPDLLPPQMAGPSSGPFAAMASEADAARQSPLDDAERAAIIAALEAHGGHREKTAEALGVSRRTLQYKLKKYGLTRRS